MRNLSLVSAIAGLLMAGLTGCATSPVLRGQSPDAYSQAPDGGYGDYNYDQYNYGSGVAQDSYQNYYPTGPMGDGSGKAMPRQCYKFQYVVPSGLNYPPPNAMPGVLQYPYYTVKGPDCFFHQ